MEDAQQPYQQIEALVDARRTWTDQALLAELTALPVLPDEDNPAWNDERTYRDHAYLFVALADVVAERRLQAALPLLLERASYGDPGEMMRGLRHALEAAVKPEWTILTDICMRAASLPQRGARLWAINELGILRDPSALETLLAALHDPADHVRHAAAQALAMLSQTNVACRQSALEALRQFVVNETNSTVVRAGYEALTDIESMS